MSTLTVQWNGKPHQLSVTPTTTVAEIKEQLQRLTNVLTSRQKLMGLNIQGKPAPDTVRSFSSLALSTAPNWGIVLLTFEGKCTK